MTVFDMAMSDSPANVLKTILDHYALPTDHDRGTGTIPPCGGVKGDIHQDAVEYSVSRNQHFAVQENATNTLMQLACTSSLALCTNKCGEDNIVYLLRF